MESLNVGPIILGPQNGPEHEEQEAPIGRRKTRGRRKDLNAERNQNSERHTIIWGESGSPEWRSCGGVREFVSGMLWDLSRR